VKLHFVFDFILLLLLLQGGGIAQSKNCLDDQISIPEKGRIFLFATNYRPALKCTQLPTSGCMYTDSCFLEGIRRLEHESNNSICIMPTLRICLAVYLRSFLLHCLILTKRCKLKNMIIFCCYYYYYYYYYYLLLLLLLLRTNNIWRKLLLQELIVAQLANKSPSPFYGNWSSFSCLLETATSLIPFKCCLYDLLLPAECALSTSFLNTAYSQVHFPSCSFLNWNYSVGCLLECITLVLQSVRLSISV
jgi:hypothetical protein